MGLFYGFLMPRVSTNATDARVSKRISGRVNPPLAVNSEEQAVAIKDATIRLKLQILRFVAKCFCP